ncbi:hypothetical protein KP509_29G075100 [Ceratopteris richardii]|uniref:Uncharacterized protein n=1 Tax=Ceratopteris richardii TaxID=49495 RepID=A0A8T2R889_CERRI|nr:hypothetical protein KP509_29G075100 [Ceratopteris richardii]
MIHMPRMTRGVRGPGSRMGRSWRTLEFVFLVAYAMCFYFIVVRTSLRLARGYSVGERSGRLRGLIFERFWMHFNDLSDSQWRNFRGNLLLLGLVMAAFMLISNAIRSYFSLQGKGTARILLISSFAYIIYLHGAWCILLTQFQNTL